MVHVGDDRHVSVEGADGAMSQEMEEERERQREEEEEERLISTREGEKV